MKSLSNSKGASPKVTFRTSPEEKAAYERRAEAAGLTVGQWIRDVLMRYGIREMAVVEEPELPEPVEVEGAEPEEPKLTPQERVKQAIEEAKRKAKQHPRRFPWEDEYDPTTGEVSQEEWEAAGQALGEGAAEFIPGNAAEPGISYSGPARPVEEDPEAVPCPTCNRLIQEHTDEAWEACQEIARAMGKEKAQAEALAEARRRVEEDDLPF